MNNKNISEKLLFVRIISILLTIVWILSVLLTDFSWLPAIKANAAYGNLYYSINGDDTITITGYNWGSTKYIEELVIPSEIEGRAVTAIEHNAFDSRYDIYRSIESLTLPEGLLEIGDAAFYSVIDGTVTLPGSITSIGKYAFAHHNYLQRHNVTIDYQGEISDWLQINKGAHWAGEDSSYGTGSMGPDTLTRLYFHGEEVTTVVIPEDVTAIGNYCFQYCKIDCLRLPSGIRSLGSCVVGPAPISVSYAGTISDWLSIEKRGWTSGYGCISSAYNNLCAVSPYQPFVSLGIQGQTSPSYIIPEGTEIIHSFDFYDCRVSSVTIPSSVRQIEAYAFGSPNMKVYYEGDLSEFLQMQVEGGLNKLQQGTFGENVDKRSTSAYSLYIHEAAVDTIEIPKDIDKIRSYAFAGCNNLKSVVLPLSVTAVGTYAFANCSQLTSFTVHNADCLFEDDAIHQSNLFNDGAKFGGIIYGWNESTAQQYAGTHGYAFEPIESSPEGMRSLGSNPFAILLTGDTVTVKKANNAFSEIEVTAHIKPWGKETVQNAYLSIELPTWMSLDETVCQKDVSYATVNPEELVEYTWTIRVAKNIADGCDHAIRVKYGAENKTPKRSQWNVMVLAEAKDNRLEYNKDNFSFLNQSEDFTKESNPFSRTALRFGWWEPFEYVCEDDRIDAAKELTSKYSNRVYEIVKLSSSSHGVCFGMSVAVALKKAGIDGTQFLYYTDAGFLGIENQDNYLYLVKKPKDEPEVGKELFYYFIQQELPDIQELKFNQKIINDDSIMIRQLVETAKNVKTGAVPVVIGTSSHALLAYDVTEGSYIKDGTEYRYQISLNDSKELSEQYAYVTADFKQFYYQKPEKCTVMSAVNQISQETSNGNSRSLFKDYSYDLIHVYYKDAAPEAYDILTKDETVIKEVDYVGAGEDESEMLHRSYVSPDLSGGFSVVPSSGADALALTAATRDYALHVESNKCMSVDFDKAGEITLRNDSDNYYTAELSKEETFGESPWFAVTVSGKGSETVALKESENGILLTSDDLSCCNIMASNRSEKIGLALNSEATTVEIRADEQTLAVFADPDQDGVYDQMIANSTDNPPEEIKEALQIGDVNSDSIINAKDATEILIAAAKIGTGNPNDLSKEQEAVADVNDDGAINAIDATIVLRYASAVGTGVAGKITDYI